MRALSRNAANLDPAPDGSTRDGGAILMPVHHAMGRDLGRRLPLHRMLFDLVADRWLRHADSRPRRCSSQRRAGRRATATTSATTYSRALRRAGVGFRKRKARVNWAPRQRQPPVQRLVAFFFKPDGLETAHHASALSYRVVTRVPTQSRTTARARRAWRYGRRAVRSRLANTRRGLDGNAVRRGARHYFRLSTGVLSSCDSQRTCFVPERGSSRHRAGVNG
jgi:hypothetical protein